MELDIVCLMQIGYAWEIRKVGEVVGGGTTDSGPSGFEPHIFWFFAIYARNCQICFGYIE